MLAVRVSLHIVTLACSRESFGCEATGCDGWKSSFLAATEQVPTEFKLYPQH